MIRQAMEQSILRAVDRHAFSGTVLAAKEGEVIVREGYGMANVELEVPNTPQTVFRIGSVTKPLTALAMIQLADRGAIRLEDPVSRYLPSFSQGERITLKHLLSHSSGLPNYTSAENAAAALVHPATVDELIARFANEPLEFTPGEQFSYSNSGYVLLGKLIEEVSGQAYAEYMRQHIFTPAGMDDTGMDDNRSIVKRRAAGYEPDEDGSFRNASYINMSNSYAAGGMYSTVDDLYALERALSSGQLVSASALRQMHTPSSGDYGLGWFILPPDRQLIYHHGGINGFTASFMRLPQQQAAVIVLSNVAWSVTSELAHELAAMLMPN